MAIQTNTKKSTASTQKSSQKPIETLPALDPDTLSPT